MDEADVKELVDISGHERVPLCKVRLQLLPNGSCIRAEYEVMLNHLSRDPWYVRRFLSKHVDMLLEESDKHEFLFGPKVPSNAGHLESLLPNLDKFDGNKVRLWVVRSALRDVEGHKGQRGHHQYCGYDLRAPARDTDSCLDIIME